MFKNPKTHTKVKCPCGKYVWKSNSVIKSGNGKYCSMKCSQKHFIRVKRTKEVTKISICPKCGRSCLTKLGCVFCKNSI